MCVFGNGHCMKYPFSQNMSKNTHHFSSMQESFTNVKRFGDAIHGRYLRVLSVYREQATLRRRTKEIRHENCEQFTLVCSLPFGGGTTVGSKEL